VSLNQAAVSLAPNATSQFAATVQNTSNPAVTWSVNGVSGGNSMVGTISATGLYTAPSQTGSYALTATSAADAAATAKASIAVGSLGAISPATASLAPLATQQFNTSVEGFSNTSVTWSVNAVAGGNSSVGTISATGLFTAPAQTGQFSVTATSVADTFVSVNASVAVGVLDAISPATALVAPATTQQFSTSVQGFSNTSVIWSVDQIVGGTSSVGTISSSGLYTAPAQDGAHTITATSAADASVTASAAATVTTLSISPTVVTLLGNQNSQQQFIFTLPGVSNPILTWTATGGTISSSGLYTPPSQPGPYTVTVTIDSLTASASVSIFDFSISPPSSVVAPSGTQTFTAPITGLTNTSVTWSVDGVTGGNVTVGTISASGVYTAPSTIGPHTVTATSVADAAFSVSAGVTVINVAQSAVLTYHNDDARDGAYQEEVTLSTANVNSAQFGKLLSYPVDGQVYAQPLYVPQLGISGGTHDVVFVVTQNNSVYAFDADATSSQNAQTFWQDLALGPHVYKGDIEGVNPYVGILSTPVIDVSTNTIYLVAEESGKGGSTPFYLYALDIVTGANKFDSPINITGSVAGTGADSVNGTIDLESECYQRMGLALNPVTNYIYIPFGSCNHGWVLAYDKTTLQQAAIFNDTPDWQGGGLWASDGAPAIDDLTGNVYIMSGVDNGDQNTNSLAMLYNDSFLFLSATDLTLESFFTPDDNYNLAVADADLGSGSNILVPANSTYSLVTIGGGKDGNVFVINPLDMGGFNITGNNVIQTTQICTNGYNNIFSTPVFWSGNSSIYYHCNDSVISAYGFNANSAQISGVTSKGSAVFTTHGATPSLSSNGAANGIIWEIDNSNYNYKQGIPLGPSVLYAYDATNLATELYNSSQNASRDTAGQALKFTVPTIANGKVFVPTSTELDIYGLITP
jgi:hypothetical protein